jgi:hypothetical protein
LGNSTLGHGHLNLIKCPLYAEITGPISCRFSVLLFNVQAQAFVTPAYQDGIRDLVWDATGTTTPPEMIGALGEERTWAGRWSSIRRCRRSFRRRTAGGVRGSRRRFGSTTATRSIKNSGRRSTC